MPRAGKPGAVAGINKSKLMNKIEQIKIAIGKADRFESKLQGDVLDVPSLTSLKIRHLLNNLGAISTNYLEVGSHRGGTLSSVLYKNDLFTAVAIDNYSEFNHEGDTKYECLANINKYRSEETKVALIEEDCFLVKNLNESEFNMYLYDGQHTESSQQRGVTHFINNLKKYFIMLVDDWSFNGVESGTRNGIKIAGLKVLGEWIMTTPEGGLPNDHWHNGIGLFYLQKQ